MHYNAEKISVTDKIVDRVVLTVLLLFCTAVLVYDIYTTFPLN